MTPIMSPEYKLHSFEDKEKRHVDWTYDYNYFYERTHKDSNPDSPVIEEKRMYLHNLVRKLERKLTENVDIELEIINRFQHQLFELQEGRKSKLKVIDYNGKR